MLYIYIYVYQVHEVLPQDHEIPSQLKKCREVNDIFYIEKAINSFSNEYMINVVMEGGGH